MYLDFVNDNYCRTDARVKLLISSEAMRSICKHTTGDTFISFTSSVKKRAAITIFACIWKSLEIEIGHSN